MQLKGIVAMDQDRVIGNEGKMPRHEPEDLKRFKQMTQGQICLMGRNTYEGLKQYRPDANGYPHAKKNLIFSRSMESKPGIEVIHNIDELQKKYGHEIVWVLGGAKTFEALMPYIDEIYITLIPGKHQGDTFMPKLAPGYIETQGKTESGLIFQKYSKAKDPESISVLAKNERLEKLHKK